MTAQRTILLVEDEQDFRHSVTTLLEHEGFRVLAARDGYEALRMLAHVDRPCLVLLDMAMPLMGGRELLEGLDARGVVGKFPVVVVTAGREPVQGLRVQEVLLKPFTREALVDVVRRNLQPAA